MEKLKKPLKDNVNPSKEYRKREYQSIMSQIKGVKLVEYEDAVVLARSILDAAQDEEVGHITSRPHILIPFTRHGFVRLTREKNMTICFVKIKRVSGGEYVNDEGHCEIHDPSGAIFEAASSGLFYVERLYREFYKH